MTGDPKDASQSRFAGQTMSVKETPEGFIGSTKLDHSPGESNKVALFIPKGFDPSKPAIMMPYFHGHGGSINDSLTRQRMTEIAAQSGKNIVFVVPQLGDKSEVKGAFSNPAYVQKYFDEAADGLTKLYTQTHPGADAAQASKAFHEMPIVPVSYSGGYLGTWSTLSNPRVKGVILLDTMYSSAKPFVNFAERPDHPFVSVTVGPSTQGHTNEFAKAAPPDSAVIQPSPSTHGILVQSALASVLAPLSVDANGQVSYAGTYGTPAATVATSGPATATARTASPAPRH